MKTQSVISLDPIDRQKKDNIISRFFKTRRFKGKSATPTHPFSHILFCGRQRQGKTASCLWYAERLIKRFTKENKRVIVFSNIGIGIEVKRSNFLQLLNKIEYNQDYVYIFIIDEIQAWFPKDTKNRELLDLIDALTGEFSQLGKRQIYVLSTAQVYGRVNKNLREQCLYMVNCRLSTFRKRFINEFILSDDILCDELGRWSGVPEKIYVHGLSTMKFDTHKRVKLD